MAFVDVKTEIMIAAPGEAVAAFAADPSNAPLWYVNIKSAEWKSEKKIAVGSLIAFRAQFLGKKLEYVYEIADYIPGKKMVMRTADGPFPMETTYEWFDTGENATRMTLRNCGKPSGFSRLLAPLMVRAMRKANNNDLKKLKQILEQK